jgi:hypothetical protein
MSNKITITWQAFGTPTSATIDWSTNGDSSYDAMLSICNKVFEDTNKYQGALWDVLEPLLPQGRTHTALSVGDTVTFHDTLVKAEPMDGIVFTCAPMGWTWDTGTTPSPLQSATAN